MSITTTQDGAVATVTLDRPDKMNALTREMREGLIETFQKLRFDRSVRAILLTGAGKNFCAGADVDKMADGSGITEARTRLQSLSHLYMRLIHALE